MKNKKLLTTTALTTIIALTGVTSKLYAQSKNFSGPYISIGTGAMENDYTVKTDSPAATPTAGTDSSSIIEGRFIGFNNTATTILSRTAQSLSNKDINYIGTSSLGYNIALDEKFLIGFDISGRTGAGTQSIGTTHTISTVGVGGGAADLSATITNTSGTGSIKVKDKAAYAFSIKPTYVVDKDLAIYAKIGYGITSLEANFITADGIASHSASKDVNGHTLGLGATYLINKQTFLDFGVDYTKNDDFRMSKNDSTVTPTLTSLDINTTQHTLSETIDSSSIGAFIRVGMKF